MKKKIIIIGTGAVAAELTSYIEDCKEWSDSFEYEIKGYIDNEVNIELYWKRYKLKKPVLGSIDTYEIQPEDNFVVGISNMGFRKKMIQSIEDKGGKLINLIHPSAIVASTAELGIGNIINPYCIIGPNTKIGNYNLLTAQSVISHDSIVGDNNIFATSLLCGHVKVGNDNTFGIRSTVIPHVNIANRVLIQAGMVVDKNVVDDAIVFHRFKEKVISIPKQ